MHSSWTGLCLESLSAFLPWETDCPWEGLINDVFLSLKILDLEKALISQLDCFTSSEMEA